MTNKNDVADLANLHVSHNRNFVKGSVFVAL